jgi:hypothetical protein
MNIIHKILASVGIGKIEILPEGEKLCCLPVQLPLVKGLDEVTNVREAKKRFKTLAVKYLFKIGDRIPPEARFNLTLSGIEVAEYELFVSGVCLDQVNEWRKIRGL